MKFLTGLIPILTWAMIGVESQIPTTCPAPPPSKGFLKNSGCYLIRKADGGTIADCCDKKDECYSNCKETKSGCDEAFRECMLDLCINEFVPANPTWDTSRCIAYWNQLEAAGSKRWRLERAEDFSCVAYEQARKTARCSNY
ncbi:hypothetical protein K7432_008379 [Basidiobolus ranarum]|uniref:Uncharacterized protein n=1 Tax=Basidiobolus ranarum TaxID=34480 RepID=A0ABR2VZL8_9FUNG